MESHSDTTNRDDSILFVCVGNSARSQMAEGFLKNMAPHIRVQSAGTAPKDAIAPEAIKVMHEIGIDITDRTPKAVTPHMLTDATEVISMGCMDKEACPAFFTDNVTDWQIEDPVGKSIEEVRKIRDEIRDKVSEMINRG